MSEDFRNGKPAVQRKYYVANRGSDSDDGSDDDRPAINEYNAYQYPSAYHPKQPSVDHYDHHRPTLKTDLGSVYPPPHPARHPPSSSPSSASSQSQPADEPTQVPHSTRGHPLPLPSPPTMAGKSMQSLHDVFPINDRPPQDVHPLRGGYPSHMRPPPAWGNGSGPRGILDPASARRPKTSPSITTPDSAASSSSFPQTEAVTIFVTTEGAPDSMSIVDVTGVKDGSFIRRCILAKTHPNSDGMHTLSIYRTLLGNSTFGGPLSDDQLMEVVRNEGDSRGTLRFFVSQTENDQQASVPVSRSDVSAIPPLRPKRRSRSRQNSVSSSVSDQPFELGYDADRDDDDSRKSSARQANPSHLNGTSGSPPSPIPRRRQVTGPLPPQPAGPPPAPPNPQPIPPSQLQHQAYPPPTLSHYAQHMPQHQPSYGYHHPSSPISQPTNSKPPTPPSYFDRQQPSSARSTFVDRYGQVVQTPGPPPPLSPRRPDFSPEEPTSSISTMSNPLSHGRSNSDASGEHEQTSISPEVQYEGFSPRYTRPQGVSNRSRNDSPRDSLFPSRSRRAVVGDQDWASSNGSDSNLTVHDTTRPSQPRLASSRHRSQVFKPPGTTQPLTTVNGSIPQRGFAGSKQIALEKALRSRPPDSHGLKPKSSSEVKSLVKGKSMDNLRQTLPISKSAGRSPLPQIPTRSSALQNPGPYTPSSSYGSARSYEPTPRPVPPRALPVQGSYYPQSPDTSRFRQQVKASPHLGLPSISSPSRDGHPRDPFPRPRSAADNTSPTQQRPSPSFGSNLSSNDYFRPVGPVSPNRLGIAGPRPPHHQSNHSDRSSDVPSGPETSNSTPPPRTPISPVGSRPSPQGNIPLVVELSSPASDSNSGTFIDSHDSEKTIRDDSKAEIQAMLKNMNAMLSQQHLASLNSNPPSTINDNSDGEDYGGGGTWVSHGDGGTWIVAPKRPPSIRPELSKLDTNLPSDSEAENATLRRPPPQAQSRSESNHGLHPQRAAPNPTSQNRVSGFAEDPDDWAPRPLPEDVLDRLEEFFPEHDLDRLVIEANSGGNSPVTVEPSAPFPAAQTSSSAAVAQPAHPRRHKKSIRIVAEEQKKRMHNRVSREDTVYANNALLRKRNTKLWDYKVEEVDTMHMKSSSIPESPSSTSSPSAPTFKWVRGELIGKGTYGRVYLALNATTGEMIAVKQVELPQTPSDRNDSRQNTVVQALKLESETLKDLDHPHIVQYLGFEETPANLSIFLEYVPGGSIGSWLHKHGSFREDVTKSFTAQILAGLEYLHSKGIIHRDLKADNILVEMNGTCKISDFGISKRTDELQGAFTALQGTVFWMAPEVINTQGKGYNFKIDIWSVGCVVLEMWGGRRPWTGQEMVAVMFKLYEAKLPPPVPDDVVLSELADDLRQKCFAINPDERPSAAELRRHPYLELSPNWIFPGFGR